MKSLKVSTSSLGKTTGSINVNPISLKQVGVQSDTNEKLYFDRKNIFDYFRHIKFRSIIIH